MENGIIQQLQHKCNIYFLQALSSWDRLFDEKLKPVFVPDNRDKASRVTAQTVRHIYEKAKSIKEHGNRIRFKQFTEDLKKDGVMLSSKTIIEILISNDLASDQTRNRRPIFYQSLYRKIPNGLLSVDGIEFTVRLGDNKSTFNVELGVNVASFSHTSFSVADTGESVEVIKVLESHMIDWGTPIGMCLLFLFFLLLFTIQLFMKFLLNSRKFAASYCSEIQSGTSSFRN